ncbi:hypothetical protein [Thioalkalivibrio sulfidiphilus]|uniref:hypothetical protein n=1 Tax=Thioalkalivibrio sulfidiphilus TaxID=1033854 RepID=UPI00037389D7|nr:hypothetical protein [Thioalkalivibrio sulfidiphilus]
MSELMLVLRELIGREAVVDGVHCQVIEILESGPRVVVCETVGSHIQSNQFGDPQRRVPRTHTLPLRSAVHDDLHPVVRTLAGAELAEQLRRLLQA